MTIDAMLESKTRELETPRTQKITVKGNTNYEDKSEFAMDFEEKGNYSMNRTIRNRF